MMTANETDSVWPARSGNVPDETKRSLSWPVPGGSGAPARMSVNWPGTMNSKNSPSSRIVW